MKASVLLRGRSKAFGLDAKHLSVKAEEWSRDYLHNGGVSNGVGEPEHATYRHMRIKIAGYELASKELANIADELERAGL